MARNTSEWIDVVSLFLYKKHIWMIGDFYLFWLVYIDSVTIDTCDIIML